MATGDLFGLDNFSYLSPANQDTAKTIRDSFARSMAQRDRYLARFPGLLPPSGPMAAEFANDEALRRAQVTSGIINNNQQLQNVIDASHATPHGVTQNLAAYLPLLGAGLKAFPALFGQGPGSELSRQGLIPYAANAIQKAYYKFTGNDGTEFALDENGKLVGTYDKLGNVQPWQGSPGEYGGTVPNYPTQGPINYSGWPDAYNSATQPDYGGAQFPTPEYNYNYDIPNTDFGGDFGSVDFGT